jgi:hypothetical protein
MVAQLNFVFVLYNFRMMSDVSLGFMRFVIVFWRVVLLIFLRAQRFPMVSPLNFACILIPVFVGTVSKVSRGFLHLWCW